MIFKTDLYLLLSTNNAAGCHDIGSIILCKLSKKHEQREKTRK